LDVDSVLEFSAAAVSGISALLAGGSPFFPRRAFEEAVLVLCSVEPDEEAAYACGMRAIKSVPVKTAASDARTALNFISTPVG
jgi:hypothetical protein